MARKKIVFIIVEGSSDDTALGVLFSRIYDKNTVYVKITYGDITSAIDVNAGNIIRKVAELIRSYADNNHFKKVIFSKSFTCLIRTEPIFQMNMFSIPQRLKSRSIQKRRFVPLTAQVY